MKKTLILLLVVSFAITLSAQKAVVKPGIKSVKAITAQRVGIDPGVSAPSMLSARPTQLKAGDGTNSVTVVPLGTSANGLGWSYGGGQKTLVWADDRLNTITAFHRMGGPDDPGGYSGDLAYDISKDGGNTWTTMTECWNAVENSGGTYYEDAGRYPNHAIYNPEGNTNPDNAYVSFFGPTTSATNGDLWGGYCIGTSRIGDPTDSTREWRKVSPTSGILQYIPDGYTITKTGSGEAWVTDIHQDWSTGTVVYMGNLLINHGIWNDTEHKFDFTEYLMDFPTIDGSRPVQSKVAFSPDGMTGYIAVLADNGEVPIAAGNSYFPVFYKTTDGGMSWDGPISVTLGGPDGIWEVENYLTDAQLAELFLPPVPARDEVPYTTAFDFDLAVDAWGNPHIAVVVGVTGSDVYSIVSAYPYTCVFDITSWDGGETWTGHQMGRPKTFRGTFGTDYTEDNRTQIASTLDGTKMFVTWLDTDLPGITDNNQPDVYCRGLNVETNLLTTIDSSGYYLPKPHNVTAFSEAMWQAYFQITSTYVLEDASVYTIPIGYEFMSNPQDLGAWVRLMYIKDFTLRDDDFRYVGIQESQAPNKNLVVTQNNPNPVDDITSFNITLNEPSAVAVSVTNITGQKVMELPAKQYGSGTHTITLDVSQTGNGVYMFTVQAGNERISRKMILK